MSRTLILYLLCGLTALFSCKKNYDQEPAPRRPEPPREGTTVNTSIFGRVVNEKDEAMQGASVTAGGKSAKTDENGYYLIPDIQLDQARGYLTAHQPGYFKASRIVPAVKNGLTEPSVMKLLPQKSIGKINAARGGKVSSAGGTQLELPANAIENYSGEINVVAAYLNPTRPDFFAISPGDMAAENNRNERVGLISYGMSYMELLDNSGNELKLKPDATATLTLPVPQTILTTAPPTIPMWYFDETKGIWVEDGEGKLENGKYTGKVKHFTIWNYDKPAVWFAFDFNLKWFVPNITSISEEQLDLIFHQRPPKAVVSIKEPNGNTVHSTVVNMNTNVSVNSSNYNNTPAATHQSQIVYPAHSDEVKITVTPLFPGGPEYPTSSNHSAINDDPPFPETINEGETEEKEVTVNIPPRPNSTVEISIPGSHQGGNGETIVNVNGKALNCDNKPVTKGYAYLAIKAGNEIVRIVTAPVFGSEGRFSVQYLFMKQLPRKVDNIELTIYDMETNKKSRVLKHTVNPSVALMLPDPVNLCDNNEPTDPQNLKTIANATISNPVTLKNFVDAGWEAVSGRLRIESSAITDLAGLTRLKQVNVLEIISTNITTIGALAQLESISGSIRVDNNPLLAGFVLPQLLNKKLAGGLYFQNNPLLVSVSLPSLENINEQGQAIAFENVPALTTLSLPALKTFNTAGQINIINTSLPNLDMFANASGILPHRGAYGLNVMNNKQLKSITGLRNIQVNNAFVFDANPLLTSLEGLKISDKMDQMTGTITRNPVLTSITLSFNQALQGSLVIASNAELKSIHLPNTIETGSIDISENNKLTTVQFPKLKTADGIAIYYEPALTGIQAPSLEILDGQLYLGHLKSLTAIDFPRLRTVTVRLEIAECDGITAYDGFNSLQTITGNLSIHSGKDQAPVTSMAGFTKLTNVTRSILIRPSDHYNAPLTKITGFSSLTTVGETLQITGANITSLTGFKNLKTAGNLTINNTGILNLDDFSSLTTLQMLNLNQNDRLSHIRGLSNLTVLSHNLWISSNPALENINGLEKITTISLGNNSSIEISSNGALTNLDGLKNLTHIKSNLKITANTKLSSLCGLKKLIDSNGVDGSYYVFSNNYNPSQQDIKNGKCSN